MPTFNTDCPLLYYLFWAFADVNIPYDKSEMYEALLKSSYNDCFTMRRVRLFFHNKVMIVRALTKDLKRKEDSQYFSPYLLYAYACICYKHSITFQELEDLMPIMENEPVVVENPSIAAITYEQELEQRYNKKRSIYTSCSAVQNS